MDMNLTFKQKANKYGLEGKTYSNITTEDGYILQIFNIYKKDIAKDAPVILCMNGIACCSDYWVSQEEQSPAIILANAGYNVFLGNNRGTVYGRRHKTLDPEKDS
jgi:pimeloyl-ACP methyl ester carboxylesterase